MKHPVILLIASLTLAGCGEKTSNESPGQAPPPGQEQPAQPTAAEPTAPPDTTPQPASPASTPSAAKPAAPPSAPGSETAKPEPPPPEQPKPKEEPKPTEQPKPKEEPKPAPLPQPLPQKPAAPPSKKSMTKDVAVLTRAKLGAVTLEHKLHAERDGNTCTSCHHPSKPEKPATTEQQACSDCHTRTATPPMKTRLPAAFHDVKAQSGTCIDCHRKENASGKKAPLKCQECHKKG
jgi:hypothetical protein